MTGRRRFASEIVCLMAACLWVPAVLAQQEQEEKPKPAARVSPLLFDTSGDRQDTDQGTQTMQPDNRPLSGIQSPTLGTTEMRHSYWVPGIEYSNVIRSTSLNSAANSAWNTTSYVSGNVSLLDAWNHSVLSANYSGGGFSSSDPVQGNGQYHQLATAFEVDQRRWQLLLVNQFSYLPESAFGFGGTSGLAFPGIMGTLAVPLPALQSTFVPGQTILTANGPRYSNTTAVQLTYGVSPRSGVFTGSTLDQANATWSRPLTRTWNGRVNLGYAKNRRILSVSGLTSPSYDAWLAGAKLSRALGRAADFSVAYQAQIENSNVAICSTPNCGTSYLAHQVFLTFGWHTRPLLLK